MIDSIVVDRFPITIYASPRTGSTLVADILRTKYSQLKSFNESFAQGHDPVPFIEYAKNNNLYILKTMALDYSVPGTGFNIRVRRKNLLDQITSGYIAKARNTWVYHKSSTENLSYSTEILPVDNVLIKRLVHGTIRYNHAVDNLNISFDQDLWYEDFVGSTSDNFLPTIQPLNYKEIQEAIKLVVANLG